MVKYTIFNKNKIVVSKARKKKKRKQIDMSRFE